MADYNSPVDARNDLMDYLYDREDHIPDDVREELLMLLKVVSPVVFVVESVKLVIDRQPDCPQKLVMWAADASLLCANFALGGIDGDAIALLKG